MQSVYNEHLKSQTCTKEYISTNNFTCLYSVHAQPFTIMNKNNITHNMGLFPFGCFHEDLGSEYEYALSSQVRAMSSHCWRD